MDINVLVTLLTITVIILSTVIIVLLGAVAAVLIKINRIAKSIDAITQNVASASDWLSPMKAMSNIARLFRK